MAYFTWVARIVLFLLLLGFAARNLDVVHVHGFLGFEWQAPLVLVMLAALVVGVLLGAVGALRTALALRRPVAVEPAPGFTALPEPVDALVKPLSMPPSAAQALSDEEGA